MKIFSAFVIAALISSACVAEVVLLPGKNEVKTTAFRGSTVTIVAELGVPTLSRCSGWRWGAEGECPKLALVGLNVWIGQEQIFVPISAFADLGTPARMQFKTTPTFFELIVLGGDAATAYVASLRFSRTELRSRRTTGREFPSSAWEETKYSFPK